MSSGFVTGGTIDDPKERDAEWLQAQKDLETSRREKEEATIQDGGKSLYEVLQANKAAKQTQFEESIRLKNQFRALDDDEIDFLDSVLESTRENERKIKQETVEQLDEFRKQRAEADKIILEDQSVAGRDGELVEQGMSWGKKRKRKEKDPKTVIGAKLRRSSTATEEAGSKRTVSAEISSRTTNKDLTACILDEQRKPDTAGSETRVTTPKATLKNKTLPQQASATSPTGTSLQTSPTAKPNLGLVGYGSSDSDSD